MKLALGTLTSEENIHYSTTDKESQSGKMGCRRKKGHNGKKGLYSTT